MNEESGQARQTRHSRQAARSAMSDAATLINANIKRFEPELRAGYKKFCSEAKTSENAPATADLSFEAWAFRQVDAVFNDMLDAKVDHKSAESYVSDVASRLKMKIKRSIEDAGRQTGKQTDA